MECKRCVLDSSVSDIQFDEEGFCNYCTSYLEKRAAILKSPEELLKLLAGIKAPRKKYDCIVGVSGGLDSSFLLCKAVSLGLRPLAVHVDTGWNSSLSVSNIEALTNRLQVDLETFVLDWNQFKQVQIAYLRSGVIDLEFPTDHYYLSALYHVANDRGISTIITGNNYSSEGIMPECWIHNKGDTLNMLDIYRKHGEGKSIAALPTLTLFKRFYYYNIKRIRNVFLLNYLDYNREDAKQLLRAECNWQEHPVKHGESIYTRFYHRYILPERFSVDIRRAHLSSLICTGQLSKQEAQNILNTDSTDPSIIRSDKAYVLKKLELSENQFHLFMAAPVRSHFDFRSEIPLKKFYNSFLQKAGLHRLLRISNRH